MRNDLNYEHVQYFQRVRTVTLQIGKIGPNHGLANGHYGVFDEEGICQAQYVELESAEKAIESGEFDYLMNVEN